MAVSLDRVTKVDGPAELKIEVVDGNEPLQEWVQSYWNSFGMDPALVSDAVRIEAARPDSSRIVRFIARAEGVPVGTALMRAAHGVAGIFVVSTSPEYRHRGIGAALTAAALEAGRQSGLHIGALQASASGAPLYTRMGFEKVAEYQLFSVSH
ncbi:GNAT family N-acetyltransferase (plasmid) [Streptomyces sp. NBC_01450]|uniref:GNAT family N-acetyltransferase n=1 Tax=Streptomyces sp. NBC_01450 TaxID=2903871 RepID=UPI002E328DB0|nr:GNAT family N-acetyltransferase [Streptomyces sp. NBC_01450]